MWSSVGAGQQQPTAGAGGKQSWRGNRTCSLITPAFSLKCSLEGANSMPYCMKA